MFKTPFLLRRPWLLIHDSLIDREHPDLAHLRQIQDPEKFLWAILPHAARTFSASILLLPAAKARAAAVGYLYSRILDCYEDLHPDPQQRTAHLKQFAQRILHLRKGTDIAIPKIPRLDDAHLREQTHLLLIEKCSLIDLVFLQLPQQHQDWICDLVESMAAGMATANAWFIEGGGCLSNGEQILSYCDYVIGNPIRFTTSLVQETELTINQQELSKKVATVIQLANITRDIEKDLRVNTAYHPRLQEYLGVSPLPLNARGGDSPLQINLRQTIKEVRFELMQVAFKEWDSYLKLIDTVPFKRLCPSRMAAVLMFQFTDRYYRSCSRRCGGPEWFGPKSIWRLLLSSLPSLVSNRWTHRALAKAAARMPQ